MRIRPVVIGGLAAVLALTAMSCSSNSESSSSTTAAPTTSEVIGNVLPPVVLSEVLSVDEVRTALQKL
jgi:hypothetical protein